MTKAITPTEFAKAHGYDPKTVRRVMRSMTDPENRPGSGARWEITPAAEKALIERMNRSHNRKVVTFAPIAAPESDA